MPAPKFNSKQPIKLRTVKMGKPVERNANAMVLTRVPSAAEQRNKRIIIYSASAILGVTLITVIVKKARRKKED